MGGGTHFDWRKVSEGGLKKQAVRIKKASAGGRVKLGP